MNNNFIARFTKPQFYPFLLMCAVSVVLVPQYLGSEGRVLNSGDYGWPFDFIRFLELVSSTWDDSYGFGNPASRQQASLLLALAGSGLQRLGISIAGIQQLFFLLSVCIAALGCIRLAYLLNWGRTQATVFAILYMMSSIALNYWAPEQGLNLTAYYWLPPTLALALSYQRSGKSVNLLFFALISANPSFSNPTFFVLYAGLLVICTGLVPKLATKFAVIEWARVLRIMSVFLLANLVWLMPFLSEIGIQYEMASNSTAGLISDKETAVLDSAEPLQALIASGGGSWVAGGEFAPNAPYRHWGVWVHSRTFVLTHVMLLLFSIYSMPKGRLDKRLWLLILVGYIVSVIIIAGMKMPWPFSQIMGQFFDIPEVGRAFRSVFPKVGFIVAFLWAMLASYIVREDSQFSRWSGWARLAFIMGVIAILAYPYATSKVHREYSNAGPSNYVLPPSAYSHLVRVSSEGRSAPHVLAVIPLKMSYNVHLRWGENSDYIGADFLRSYWHGPILSFHDTSVNFSRAKYTCDNSDIETCLQYLTKLGVEYVLVRKDLANQFPRNLLNRNSAYLAELIDLEFESREFDLYKTRGADNKKFFLNFENCIENCPDFSLTRINGSLLRLQGQIPRPLHKIGNNAKAWIACESRQTSLVSSGTSSTLVETIQVLARYANGDCFQMNEDLRLTGDSMYMLYEPFVLFVFGCGLWIITILVLLAGSVFRWGKIKKH